MHKSVKYYTVCPTRYQIRHFFNNSNTMKILQLDANDGHFQHMLWCRHISYTMS